MNLKGQSTISAKRGLPSESVNESFKARPVSGESLGFQYDNSGALDADAGQAAGTLVVATLEFGRVRCALGKMQASFGDSSLELTATAFTTEVEFTDTKKNLDGKSTLERLQEIATHFEEGQYCVDYEKGILYGKKADNSTSMTASYKYSAPAQSSDSDDPLAVYDSVSAVTEGATIVTTAGSAEPLSATSVPAKYIAMTVTDTNAGRIAWGSEDVEAGTNGANLGAGQTIILPVPGGDLVNLYIDSTVSGEGVMWSVLS